MARVERKILALEPMRTFFVLVQEAQERGGAGERRVLEQKHRELFGTAPAESDWTGLVRARVAYHLMFHGYEAHAPEQLTENIRRNWNAAQRLDQDLAPWDDDMRAILSVEKKTERGEARERAPRRASPTGHLLQEPEFQNAPPTKTGRRLVLDRFSCVVFIRESTRMGATPEDIEAFLRSQGFELSPSTLKIQVRRGAKEPDAETDEEEAKAIRQHLFKK